MLLQVYSERILNDDEKECELIEIAKLSIGV